MRGGRQNSELPLPPRIPDPNRFLYRNPNLTLNVGAHQRRLLAAACAQRTVEARSTRLVPTCVAGSAGIVSPAKSSTAIEVLLTASSASLQQLRCTFANLPQKYHSSPPHFIFASVYAGLRGMFSGVLLTFPVRSFRITIWQIRCVSAFQPVATPNKKRASNNEQTQNCAVG